MYHSAKDWHFFYNTFVYSREFGFPETSVLVASCK